MLSFSFSSCWRFRSSILSFGTDDLDAGHALCVLPSCATRCDTWAPVLPEVQGAFSTMRVNQARERRCLKCDVKFQSPKFTVRLCDVCRKENLTDATVSREME